MFNYKRYGGKYYSKDSCKFLMQYHLIFVVKYRKKLLTGNLNADMMTKMIDISKKYDFEIKTLQSDVDHLHFLISSTPQLSIAQIVRVLKQESTIYIWNNYSRILSRHFWKEKTFWSDGYFVSTIGDVSQATLKKYIEEQGKE